MDFDFKLFFLALILTIGFREHYIVPIRGAVSRIR